MAAYLDLLATCFHEGGSGAVALELLSLESPVTSADGIGRRNERVEVGIPRVWSGGLLLDGQDAAEAAGCRGGGGGMLDEVLGVDIAELGRLGGGGGIIVARYWTEVLQKDELWKKASRCLTRTTVAAVEGVLV